MVKLNKILNDKIAEWKEQTARQIRCQNEGTDHDLCPHCNEQLYWCDCATRIAQTILEFHFGFTNSLD